MIASIVWALVALIFILLANYRYGQWQHSRKPLGDQQYIEFNKKLDDLQNQISRLSIQRGFNDE